MSTNNFAERNSGFEAGTINGPATVEIHHHAAPERPETPPSASILIPFAPDEDFVKRDDIIERIEARLGRPGSCVALVGVGGVGKSQLAIEYAYLVRKRSSDTWVFWIHASNSARFEEGFRAIATRIKVPGRHDPNANIFQLVHDWLQDQRKGPCVIILDNVDNASFLKLLPSNDEAAATTRTATPRQLISYIPCCQHGSVLVTSRNRDAALALVEHANILAVEPMNEESALKLFQNKLGQNDDEASTFELAAALEYMPLAIVQAAAYIVQRRPRCSVQKYLDEFSNSDRRKTMLLSVEGGELRRDAEAKNSILLTWQISFEYIREIRPSAADLLSLMSFCDRQGIPECLLRGQDSSTSSDSSDGGEIEDHGTNHLDLENDYSEGTNEDGSVDCERANDSDSEWKERQSNYTDDDSFETDIITLRNFCFINVNEDGVTFEMHRLVQFATITWLRARKIYKKQRHRFLRKLCEELPAGEYENWPKSQVLYPHVEWATLQPQPGKESMREWAIILCRAAQYTILKDKEEALELSIRAMEAMSQIYGEEHNNVLCSKSLVATAYMLRGHWGEAEKFTVEVMESSKRILGEDHPTTLTMMTDMAWIYLRQSHLGEAEKLCMQVVEMTKIMFGNDHLKTLHSMNNLAFTYYKRGRLEEAERLQIQVMERRKIMLGEEHPHTLTSMGNLALTCYKQGHLGEAERLQMQVMERRKIMLGEDHPHTVAIMGDLALTFSGQGRFGEAEKAFKQVIERNKIKLGEDDPHTLASMSYLAWTLGCQGRLEEAEDLELQVLEKTKTRFGRHHPSTQLSMSKVLIYTSQGQEEKAKRLEEQLLESYKVTLGENHPDKLDSIANLIGAYVNQVRLEEAVQLSVQLLEMRRTTFGDSHPDTLMAMHDLALILGELGRSPEAFELWSCCISLRRRVLGPQHPDTQESVNLMEELQKKVTSTVAENSS